LQNGIRFLGACESAIENIIVEIVSYALPSMKWLVLLLLCAAAYHFDRLQTDLIASLFVYCNMFV